MHENALLFSRARWGIAGSLALMALADLVMPSLFPFMGVNLPGLWMLFVSAALLLANIPITISASRLSKASGKAAVEMNFWVQIAVDLSAITVLVHIAGSTTTFAPFLYLLHIVLGCVFFPVTTSLLIWALSASLYGLVVSLETSGIIEPHSIWIALQADPLLDRTMAIVQGGTAPAIWLAIWALVAMLTHAVRAKDESLQAANDRLVKANREKNVRVIRTVNDINSAFAGIKASVDLLSIRHREEMPPDAQMHVALVHQKAEELEGRLQEILMVGDIDKNDTGASSILSEVFESVTRNVMGKAWAKGVKVEVDVPSLTVAGHAHQLAALFSCLVVNGICYSQPGAVVRVSARKDNDRCLVAVSDEGAGISEKDLPKIFDDYFRSEEAKELNPSGLGLGLGVVKELCEALDLGITVKSALGKGSTFEVALPLAQEKTQSQAADS